MNISFGNVSPFDTGGGHVDGERREERAGSMGRWVGRA